MKVKAVRIAADKLGGATKLRQHLGVSSADLLDWLSGKAEPPEPVFLRALAVVLAALDAGETRRRQEG